ncbi:Alpha-acetolactate decarboxylase precursor [Poriferisphaera corsica]|uniref:Alpha-acetolactate decarboxylase n=1 Tax=Poriferisphaera corsica TaxID=2528020 RepID=A0A517YZ74_9BACT|nr:acetolactate decarboxylase [Poriferisphaera corsica]QDU35540.1 Alpha-acetolactate decarboxylase precursor [Poriferisphaera corsica]
MKRTLSLFTIATVVAVGVGCETTSKVKTQKVGSVNQIGTAQALEIGAYQGQMTVAELQSYGDFGIGVAENLNGELIMLDGELYQSCVGDELTKPAPTVQTPFATVTHFSSQKSWPVSNTMTYSDFEKLLDDQVINPEHVNAIKFTGTFDTVRYRCLTLTQNYVPYDQAVKNEHVYENDNVKGTLVGFYYPPFMGELNFKRYTFHFIQDDARHGGHLVDAKLRTGKVEMMELPDMYIMTGNVKPPLVSPR